jgi:phosphoribosylformylglycinamidine (FGAM) synthase-like enzyme
MAVGSDDGVVRGARQIVVAAYAAMPDIRHKVTPDLKTTGSELLMIDLAGGRQRLGGSVLAQVYGQVGNDCPDVEDPQLLDRAFKAVQGLVKAGHIASLHDRSDGGLITTLLEMAFGGARGLTVDIDTNDEIAKFMDPRVREKLWVERLKEPVIPVMVEVTAAPKVRLADPAEILTCPPRVPPELVTPEKSTCTAVIVSTPPSETSPGFNTPTEPPF